jgi:hypothetical protein
MKEVLGLIRFGHRGSDAIAVLVFALIALGAVALVLRGGNDRNPSGGDSTKGPS